MERLRAYIPQLLSRLYIETLIYGNVTRERATQLCDVITTTLQKGAGTKALPPSQQRRFREVQLPDGEWAGGVGGRTGCCGWGRDGQARVGWGMVRWVGQGRTRAGQGVVGGAGMDRLGWGRAW